MGRKTHLVTCIGMHLAERVRKFMFRLHRRMTVAELQAELTCVKSRTLDGIKEYCKANDLLAS